MAVVLAVMMPLLLALAIPEAKALCESFGPVTFAHFHIWQENKEKLCLQKLKTIK
jgi:hypothetical protein